MFTSKIMQLIPRLKMTSEFDKHVLALVNEMSTNRYRAVEVGQANWMEPVGNVLSLSTIPMTSGPEKNSSDSHCYLVKCYIIVLSRHVT